MKHKLKLQIEFTLDIGIDEADDPINESEEVEMMITQIKKVMDDYLLNDKFYATRVTDIITFKI